jgi:hypothetical protein
VILVTTYRVALRRPERFAGSTFLQEKVGESALNATEDNGLAAFPDQAVSRTIALLRALASVI